MVGESGCGKSVTVLAAAGLLPAARATVTGRACSSGEDLLTHVRSGLRQVRGRRLGMVFQDPMTSLNPVLTVGRQIAEGMRAHGDLAAAGGPRRARELLGRSASPTRPATGRLPAPVVRGHAAAGDDRDRAVLRPALLIADEPTTALDVTVQAQILDLVAKLQATAARRRLDHPRPRRGGRASPTASW